MYWYETFEKRSLKKVNGHTISNYKSFLADGGTIEPKAINKFSLFFIKLINLLSKKIKRPKRKAIMTQKPLSVTSRRRHLSTVKNFFEYLKQSHEDKNDHFSKNPVKPKLHAIKLKDIDVNSTELLDDEHWQLINENTYRINERGLIYLLYYAGLRLNEVRILKWKHIDLKNQLVTVARKGGKIQTLKPMMAKKVFSHLTLWSKSISAKDNDYLFQGRSKNIAFPRALGHRAMYSLIMRILNKSQIPQNITPHSFRKASATKLYKKTKDLLKVRDFLGHKDAQVTQTYIASLHHKFKQINPSNTHGRSELRH